LEAEEVEAMELLVVKINLVVVGIRGSFSSEFAGQNNLKTAVQVVGDIRFRFKVSKINKSASQLPTVIPGPPRLAREGSTRFCLVCELPVTGDEGVSMYERVRV
jgi:hypothetical protein